MNQQFARCSLNRFVDISASREILRAMEIARDIPDYPVLINSKPGMGKSTALRHHAEAMKACYREIGQPTKGLKGMLKMLIEATGFSSGYQYIADLADAACDRLADCWTQHWIVIVDEVQMLELSALRELLRIQEVSGCSLVLSGNDKRLARTRSHVSALDQIVSRLGLRVDLGPPLEGDCRGIGINFNVEGKDACEALASFGRQTSVRDLVWLLVFAEKINGVAEGIQLHHLKTAFLTIYGNKRDLKMLVG